MGATEVLIVGLVVLLLISDWLWYRRVRRDRPKRQHVQNVTRAGFLYFGSWTFVLIAGLCYGQWDSDSAFGSLVSSDGGILLYSFVVTAIFVVVERVMKSRGIAITCPAEPKPEE